MQPPALAKVRLVLLALTIFPLALATALSGCAAPEGVAEPEPLVAEDEYDPAVWSAEYPEIYETWLATAEERPAGKSAYKRGFDGGVMYDKLSEFPFMPVLFNGWGFGIDYNEPRGHHYMLIDQAEIDPARVKSGGACLTCKSPYAESLYEEDAEKLFGATYADAVAMIPEGDRELGATCIDCHDNATMELSTRRWTVDAALTEVGLDPENLTDQEQELMVCGQCHCTYSVMKDGDTVLDIDFPWEGSEWGAISVENIIESLETNPSRLEWSQKVTGMRVGFIRHPDIEFYSLGSVHMKQGLTCADCHMPDTKMNNKTVSDHNIMSPLKKDGVACQRCHYDTPEEIKAKVVAIQDATLTRLIDAGYRTATVAKLFELANSSLDPAAGDVKPTYDAAAKHYRQALYRVIFMGAENSVGFHNPAEAERILADAVKEADAADALLRELLTSRGVNVPAEVPLQLRTYLDNRGTHAKDFVREHYIPDPSGAAEQRWPASLAALLR